MDAFFAPREYLESHDGLTLENTKLDDGEVQRYGRLISRFRFELRDYAVAFEEVRADDRGLAIEEVSPLYNKLKRGYFPRSKL